MGDDQERGWIRRAWDRIAYEPLALVVSVAFVGACTLLAQLAREAWGANPWLLVGASLFLAFVFLGVVAIWRGKPEWDAYIAHRRSVEDQIRHLTELRNRADILLANPPVLQGGPHIYAEVRDWGGEIRKTLSSADIWSRQAGSLPEDIRVLIKSPRTPPEYSEPHHGVDEYSELVRVRCGLDEAIDALREREGYS